MKSLNEHRELINDSSSLDEGKVWIVKVNSDDEKTKVKSFKNDKDAKAELYDEDDELKPEYQKIADDGYWFDIKKDKELLEKKEVDPKKMKSDFDAFIKKQGKFYDNTVYEVKDLMHDFTVIKYPMLKLDEFKQLLTDHFNSINKKISFTPKGNFSIK